MIEEKLVLGGIPIGDYVVPDVRIRTSDRVHTDVRQVEVEDIVFRATCELVFPLPPNESVGTAVSDQRVVTGLAGQGIAVVVAREAIVLGRSIQILNIDQ